MYIFLRVYVVVYTRDGQHVTSMINEEYGIMPLGTAFGREGRFRTGPNNPLTTPIQI